MSIQPRYPWRSVAAGMTAAWAMLLLSPGIQRPWNRSLVRPLTVVAAPSTASGPSQAGQTRPGAGAGGHGAHTVTEAPASTANVMTLSPERLQAIGVKFELAKRRSVDRAIRT